MKNQIDNKRMTTLIELYKNVLVEDTEMIQHDINDLIQLNKTLLETASKNTHYHKLNETMDEIFEFIRVKLYKGGFVNGDMVTNSTKPVALFWWELYQLFANITYSPHLKTEVSLHHSSAYERCEAFGAELEFLKNNL